MNLSLNDTAWQHLFETYCIKQHIDEYGYFCITSKQINQYREARLMTKFDHYSQLPKLFQQYQLAILPLTRGSYILGQFEIFSELNQNDVAIQNVHFPLHLESLDCKKIDSESMAINCAFIARILHDFTQELDLVPTVNGRMGSGCFSFYINTQHGQSTIDVNQAQIEIDGGFEGQHALYLVEAKNYITDNFLIRQLYYPYRLWRGKISKPVKSIFMTYSNGVFDIREYAFTQPENYSSISLVRHKKYSLITMRLTIALLHQFMEQVAIIQEPSIPFPQADSFARVINLCELLVQRQWLSKSDITQNYAFDLRQTDYYINAARYLGLIVDYREDLSQQTGCTLSELGQQIFALDLEQRQIAFVKLILQHQVFNRSLQCYLATKIMPTKMDIVKIMKSCSLYNIQSDSTYQRRASTILGWLGWIVDLIEN